MKTLLKKRILRGTAALMASLFGLMSSATSVASTYEGMINTFMGTTSYRMKSDGDRSADTNYFKSEFETLDELVAAKRDLAIRLATEGSVLLKNENHALPLKADSDSVTIWGLNGLNPTLGGLVGSSVTVNHEGGQISYGLIEALQEKGFTLNEKMISFYKSSVVDSYRRSSSFFGKEVPGHSLIPAFSPVYEEADSYTIGEPPASVYMQEVLDSAKDTAAVVVLNRDSSEAADYSDSMTDKNGDSYTSPLALSKYEKQLIDLAKENSNGNVIVLLNTDMTMEIDSLKRDSDIDAILWTGLPGMYGFRGVADILDGTESPSGSLVDTYAVRATSAPAMVNFGVYLYDNNSHTEGSPLKEGNKADWYLVENEGIYVGYKYYETRYEDFVLGRAQADSAAGSSVEGGWNYESEVSYPFGYGLSYTTFNQELKQVDVKPGGTSTAVVEVTNTGDNAGKCAVQLYVQAPYTEGGLEKSSIILLDFGKTDVLNPGESETVTIGFDAQYMASYDENADNQMGSKGAWVLEEGSYYFSVGNGAHEALNNILANKLGSTDRLIRIHDAEYINKNNVVSVELDYDADTYSENVENALQDCDLNNVIDGSVEYTTRKDWSKGWEPVQGIRATEEMLGGLTNGLYTLTDEKEENIEWGKPGDLTIANMLLLDENGAFTGVLGLNDPMWNSLIQQITLEEAITFIEKGQITYKAIPSVMSGEVYHNDGPIGFTYDKAPGYASHWTEEQSDEPTYVPSDSKYAAWSMTEMPTEPVVAATFNKKLVEREGQLIGEDGLWAKIPAIMAPGLNIHRATYCARNHEYYSEDSMLTNLMGTVYCSGTKSKGLLTEPKHFIMNHQEANRSGVSTFFTEQGAREGDLRAFQGALQNNYSGGLMTAFNRLGVSFSGAHKGLLEQILRKEWGYTGYIVTDMINGPDYMNWRDIIAGGGGICLTTEAYEKSEIGSMATKDNMARIAADEYFQKKMQETLRYSLYNFANSSAMNGVSITGKLVRVTPWWKTALYVLDAVIGLLAAAAFAGYVLTASGEKKKYKQ